MDKCEHKGQSIKTIASEQPLVERSRGRLSELCACRLSIGFITESERLTPPVRLSSPLLQLLWINNY